MEKIEKFVEENYFLSTMSRCFITINGITYPTVEHAFQASKTRDTEIQQKIADMENPVDAVRFGRTIKPYPAWLGQRLQILERLLEIKFQKDTYKNLLIATGDAEIEHRNDYGDAFFGIRNDNNQGQNWLGRLTQKVREKIKNTDGWLMEEV